MTPEHPGFAAAVRVARRALAERIAASAAASATDGKTRTDSVAVAPPPTSPAATTVPPLPSK